MTDRAKQEIDVMHLTLDTLVANKNSRIRERQKEEEAEEKSKAKWARRDILGNPY